jgi:hypothetical protein
MARKLHFAGEGIQSVMAALAWGLKAELGVELTSTGVPHATATEQHDQTISSYTFIDALGHCSIKLGFTYRANNTQGDPEDEECSSLFFRDLSAVDC